MVIIYRDKIMNFVHQDCMEYLAKLSDNSVDMVLTDPPYYIGYDGGDGWDNQWIFEDEYLHWCYEWTRECIRVLKPNRMMIVWGTLKHDTFMKYVLNVSSSDSFAPIKRQNEIVWSYNWGGRSKNNFARKHEYAFCFSKGEEFLFNGDDVRIDRKVTKSLRDGATYNSGTIPTCVWEKNNHTMSKDHCGWHPTTKNIDLLQRMIIAYTEPADTVLDIFMGSGSTAIAAVRSGRNYMGCDNNQKYYDLACNRILLG